eukprot:TRINITY_DN386481_c0_g1_i2.p1 TRINITY_DN386481_c0_g1~~TRINITY_DN386481_c0_g1_i2.p1  ORF type:complete len:891 (-),score=254.33 TRINITY_DN386481_c0_g1_i2:173-2845(-)
MTTEILRSMLYRGDSLLRDIEWVIFDEVHYVNDADRGVVWEEVIILLPEHVSMLFLSATTPNTEQFCEWIGQTKKRPVHVIKTSHRPVPLQHSMIVKNEIFPLLDNRKRFLETQYVLADKFLNGKADANGNPIKTAVIKNDSNSRGRGRGRGRGGRGAGGRGRGQGRESRGGFSQRQRQPQRRGRGGGSGSKKEWLNLIRQLEKNEALPTVVFTLSRNKCDSSAGMLFDLSLVEKQEEVEIENFFRASVLRLSPVDRDLPQVHRLRQLVSRGIAVHHSGLLPILKEAVEMLYSRGLVKLLFATETFAMGVNMPTKSVLFNGIKKYDGENHRFLIPSEYTQMAGRAGRRGKDKFGRVHILQWGDELPDKVGLRMMMTGAPIDLKSRFRLTYTMIVNLLRVDGMTVEDMMTQSFSNFSTQRLIERINIPDAIARLTQQLDSFEDIEECPDCGASKLEIQKYAEHNAKAEELRDEMSVLVNEGLDPGSKLESGRVYKIYVGDSNKEYTAMILPQSSGQQQFGQSGGFPVALVLIDDQDKQFPPSDIEWKPSQSFGGQEPVPTGVVGRINGMRFVVIKPAQFKIRLVCKSITAKGFFKRYHYSDVLDGDSDALIKCLEHIKEQSAAPLYLPHSKRNKEAIMRVYDEINEEQTLLDSFICGECPKTREQLESIQAQEKIKAKRHKIQHLSAFESLKLFPDFCQRLEVLRRMDYIGDRDLLALKGRVCCEINTCHELILTELVFQNVFVALEPPEIVGLLSALVCQGRSKSDDPQLNTRLQLAKKIMFSIGNDIINMQKAVGMEVCDERFFNDHINIALMEVSYEWASGLPFKNICTLTDVPEGAIVRTITRVSETCREVRNIARVLGDSSLYKKMDLASNMIQRDIVFAASLYVS